MTSQSSPLFFFYPESGPKNAWEFFFPVPNFIAIYKQLLFSKKKYSGIYFQKNDSQSNPTLQRYIVLETPHQK